MLLYSPKDSDFSEGKGEPGKREICLDGKSFKDQLGV